MGKYEGKVALVMGASTPGGMGQATARRLVAEGAQVVVSGLGREGLEAVGEELSCGVIEADITSREQMRSLVASTKEQYGGLHLAVNHAGLADRMPVRDITEEHLMKMTAINYFGTVWFIQAVAEGIVHGGAIVTTSSLSAHDFMSSITAYASAKRAADRYVQAAAVEYREQQLRINAIIPSMNDTAMLRKGVEEFGSDFDIYAKTFTDLTPLGRLSTPEDIAAMVCMMLSDDFFETGQLLHCSGGNSLLGHPRAFT